MYLPSRVPADTSLVGGILGGILGAVTLFGLNYLLSALSAR
jgi:hypothetical protein